MQPPAATNSRINAIIFVHAIWPLFFIIHAIIISSRRRRRVIIVGVVSTVHLHSICKERRRKKVSEDR